MQKIKDTENSPVLDYDREAPRYDATRGGERRAGAAAEAYEALLTAAAAGPVVDLACGTGSVTAALDRRTQRAVIGLDISAGMLAPAARRLPGRIVRADATRLPFADASAGAAMAVWLLHLLPDDTVERVIAEVARILSPGGVFATTVDKNGSGRHEAPDSEPRIRACALASGLAFDGATTFVGHGQGRGSTPNPVYRVWSFVRRDCGVS